MYYQEKFFILWVLLEEGKLLYQTSYVIELNPPLKTIHTLMKKNGVKKNSKKQLDIANNILYCLKYLQSKRPLITLPVSLPKPQKTEKRELIELLVCWVLKTKEKLKQEDNSTEEFLEDKSKECLSENNQSLILNSYFQMNQLVDQIVLQHIN